MKSLFLSTTHLVIYGIMLLFPIPASSAEFKSGVGPDGRTFYVLDGDIARGDAQKLLDLIRRDLYSLSVAYGLLVDSQGGDVAEAIKIAEVVERYWLPVEVASDGECSSACFFIYVAAPHRNAYGAVRIHAPFYDLEGIDATQYAKYAEASRIVHEATRSFLLARSVPSELIEKMLSLASTSAYTLTLEDRDRIGFESAFAKEIGVQKCGGNLSDRLMTQEEIRRYKSCTNMALLEARLFHVWGDKSGIAKEELGELGRAYRQRVMPSPDYTKNEKLDMQKNLGSIVTRLPPGAWVKEFDRYLKLKNL